MRAQRIVKHFQLFLQIPSALNYKYRYELVFRKEYYWIWNSFLNLGLHIIHKSHIKKPIVNNMSMLLFTV